jgi:hypothetical protein
MRADREAFDITRSTLDELVAHHGELAREYDDVAHAQAGAQVLHTLSLLHTWAHQAGLIGEGDVNAALMDHGRRIFDLLGSEELD